MLIKLGELIEIQSHDIKTTDLVLLDLDVSILDNFRKTAVELKKIAPKAKDFLYFTAVFMHSAEASLYDDSGELRKDAKGKPLEAKWEVNEKTGSWKWITSDPDLKPYKNANADIFPESELKKAYKKWVGKPLCLDHKSSSVDMIRGVIVDTFYDEKLKRVIGLCALDKVNYPDLARKVSTGYATAVSMGTAVGKAICSDCGQVAKVESDFCKHMRAKSCYGEINIDLSPIELSIVVNGADPKAKIRHIVAAADSIAKYIEQKEEVAKTGLSSKEFSQLEKDLKKAQDSLDKLKLTASTIEKNEFVCPVCEKSHDDPENTCDYEQCGYCGFDHSYELEQAYKWHKENDPNNELYNADDGKSKAYGQPGRGTLNMAESEIEPVDKPWGPVAHFGSSESEEIKKTLTRLEEKLGTLNNFINKMASIESQNNFNKETDMSTDKKAYFQGGGGVNEPAPKQVKYPKEDEDSIRNSEDKQMTGQMDTGGSDGMHPGYDSFGESEEARKKRLCRAEVEERALRRQAALKRAQEVLTNKEAYFNGGGGDNEPTPGKPKYPKEDSDSTRAKEDKHMVGESPFPGVGKVDGLYGDDAKTKQMLNRAKLIARFVKAANSDGSDNLSASGWQVFAKTSNGERLILSATVGEMAGGKAEVLYDSIATKDFGKKIITTIKSEGYDKAIKLFKGAQEAYPPHIPSGPDGSILTDLQPGPVNSLPTKEDLDKVEGFRMLNNGKWPESFTKKHPTYAPFVEGIVKGAQAVAGPAAAPGAPVDSGLPPEAPADMGSDGDPLEQVENHLNEMDNLVADSKKALEALKDEDTTDLDALAPPTAGVAQASVSLSSMRKTLNNALQKGLKQAIAELDDHIEELNLVKHIYNNTNSITEENSSFVSSVAADALKDSKNVIANVNSLHTSFAKYARGTEALLKKVAEEKSEEKDENDACDEMMDDDSDAGTPNDWKDVLKGLKNEMNPEGQKPPAAFPGRPAQKPVPGLQPDFTHGLEPLSASDGEDENDAVEFKMNPDGSMEGTADKLTDIKAASEDPDLTTKEGRAQMRAKIAQKGLKFSDMIDKAHPSGGTTLKLETKPSGDLGKVEDIEEIHNKMMDVATAPVKVKQAAEQIQKLVLAGKINPETDFPALISEGLDSEAVKYWKGLYVEAAEGGTQFASELVKEYEKKKAATESEKVRVKIARAYELAHDMADKGIIGSNREAITEQVDDIMKWNDESFNSMKKVIARQNPMTKSASIPRVGVTDSMLGNSDVVLPAVEAAPSDLVKQLEAAFSGRRY